MTAAMPTRNVSCLTGAIITVPGNQGGTDREIVKERGEGKRKKVIPTHHSAGCCGVAERFIDHPRMHSVRADEESGGNGW